MFTAKHVRAAILRQARRSKSRAEIPLNSNLAKRLEKKSNPAWVVLKTWGR
jgi:hypothetical protein